MLSLKMDGQTPDETPTPNFPGWMQGTGGGARADVLIGWDLDALVSEPGRNRV